MTVVGDVIKAVGGKDIPFPTAAGLDVSENGLLLTAAISGRLLRKDNKLSVLPELEVRGDVDFSVGNIDFTGSVRILGAVRDGFHVLAEHDIEVRGMVEGSEVESSANIVVTGGILGMGKGRVIAAGSVTADFAEQAYIRSGEEIKIKNSVLHSDLGAQQAIMVTGGRRSQIIGGKVQAGVAVLCNALGSEIGTKTEVSVGLSPELAERRKELRDLIAKYDDNLKKLETNLEFLKRQEQTGVMNENHRALIITAMKTKFQLQAVLVSSQNELQDIEKRFEMTKYKGIVRVRDICYPGVSVTIWNSTYVVRESFKYGAFIYDESAREVRLRSFDI